MFDKVFGYPILKLEMPNHADIKEQFKPFVEDKENFGSAAQWDCDCGTTLHHEEKNQQLPWDIFFTNIQPALNEYLKVIGMQKEYAQKLYAHAWANRYEKGQHQEIHAHLSGNNLISCAYMLDIPSEGPDAGQFIFYNSVYAPFEMQLMDCFYQEARETYMKRYNPYAQEGEIIFFPSSLDHYVTWNQTDSVRATISANFSINFD